MKIFSRLPLALVYLCFVAPLGLSNSVRAGSATWDLNPASGDWNTAANWTPMTIPNGAADVARFDLSNTTAISISAAQTTVDGIIFAPGASRFTITATPNDFFNTGVLPPNAGPPGSIPPEAARSYTYVVKTAGTYTFVCLLHAPSGMAGSLKVA